MGLTLGSVIVSVVSFASHSPSYKAQADEKDGGVSTIFVGLGEDPM